MAYFIKHGNCYSVTDDANIDITKQLPAGNYTIKETMQGLVLEGIDSFQNPAKVYGTTLRSADRIISTFLDRPAGTGVMLAGYKGSGKTMLARALSIQCAEQGIPCIVVNQPFAGDSFNKLLQSISQPCMVLFDEFEKVYAREAQPQILTLLDGVFPSKKLYVLTCNDKYRVDEHMRNRPGRLFYVLEFDGIDMDFIRDYCRDTLKNQDHIEQVCNVSMMFKPFTFDMLKAIVEEMNRYAETATESLKILNVAADHTCRALYNVRVQIDGEPVESIRRVYTSPVSENTAVWLGPGTLGLDEDGDETDDFAEESLNTPPTPEFSWAPGSMTTETKNDSDDKLRIVFTPADLRRVNSEDRKFTFYKQVSIKGAHRTVRLDLTEHMAMKADYWGAF